MLETNAQQRGLYNRDAGWSILKASDEEAWQLAARAPFILEAPYGLAAGGAAPWQPLAWLALSGEEFIGAAAALAP